MRRVEYDIKLIQHKTGSLTARVTSNKSKQVSVFKISAKHKDNHTYFKYMLDCSMLKLDRYV